MSENMLNSADSAAQAAQPHFANNLLLRHLQQADNQENKLHAEARDSPNNECTGSKLLREIELITKGVGGGFVTGAKESLDDWQGTSLRIGSAVAISAGLTVLSKRAGFGAALAKSAAGALTTALIADLGNPDRLSKIGQSVGGVWQSGNDFDKHLSNFEKSAGRAVFDNVALTVVGLGTTGIVGGRYACGGKQLSTSVEAARGAAVSAEASLFGRPPEMIVQAPHKAISEPFKFAISIAGPEGISPTEYANRISCWNLNGQRVKVTALHPPQPYCGEFPENIVKLRQVGLTGTMQQPAGASEMWWVKQDNGELAYYNPRTELTPELIRPETPIDASLRLGPSDRPLQLNPGDSIVSLRNTEVSGVRHDPLYGHIAFEGPGGRFSLQAARLAGIPEIKLVGSDRPSITAMPGESIEIGDIPWSGAEPGIYTVTESSIANGKPELISGEFKVPKVDATGAVLEQASYLKEPGREQYFDVKPEALTQNSFVKFRPVTVAPGDEVVIPLNVPVSPSHYDWQFQCMQGQRWNVSEVSPNGAILSAGDIKVAVPTGHLTEPHVFRAHDWDAR